MFKVEVEIEITPQQIAAQMVAAFEGGSNYWIQHVTRISGAFAETPWYSDPAFYTQPFKIKVVLGADDGTYFLFEHDIHKGLPLMAKKYPQHFADLIGETGDATTADVFLQLCLFGEIVYGYTSSMRRGGERGRAMARVEQADPRTEALNKARDELTRMLRGLVGLPALDLVKLIEIFIEEKIEARRRY